MEALFLRVAVLSLTGSAVLLPLLLLSGRIHHRYAAKTCYFLWLLLALRLLLPFQFPLPQPAVTVETPVYPVSLPASAVTADTHMTGPGAGGSAGNPAAPEPVPQERSTVRQVSLTVLGAWVWAAGTAGFLLWQAVSYAVARRSLLRRSLEAGGAAESLLESLRAELGVTGRAALRRAPGLPTPMMLGLVRPVILLPGREMEPEQLDVVLRHELVHLRRRDVAYKALLLLTNAVHWFNPLVWWMVREASRNLELCCDDEVVRAKDAGFRRRYGEILLHTAAGCRAPALSTYFGGGKKLLKGRLANLFQKKKNSAAAVCVVLALALPAGSLVACESAAPLDAFEAVQALEDSIAFENGTMSFTIPKGYAKAEQWNIHIAGRAETEQLGGLSLHYFEGEPWQAGKRYTLDIAPEQWADITELTLEAYLPDPEARNGVREGRVDLLSIVRGASSLYVNDTYGFTLQLPEDWAGNYTVTESEGMLTFCQRHHGFHSGEFFSLLIDDAQEFRARYPGMSDEEIMNGWPGQMLILGEGGGRIFFLSFASDGNVDLNHESVKSEYEAMDAQARALTADAFTYTGAAVRRGAVYTNSTYGFTVRFPDGWAGRVEVAEDDGADLMTIYQSSARRADDPTAGVLANLCVVTRAVFDELYGDKDLDGMYETGGPRITVLGEAGGRLVYLHVDPLPEERSGLDPDYVRLHDEAEAITADAFALAGAQNAVYTNSGCGFSIRLPECWGVYGAVGEDPDTGAVLFYSAALGMDQGTVASLLVEEAPLEEYPARVHYLGGRDGCHVYLSFYQTVPRNLMEGSAEDKAWFEMLYDALENLPGSALTFSHDADPAASSGIELRYTSALYGFTLDQPPEWANRVEVQEFLGLPVFRMKDAGEWGGVLLTLAWMESADYDEDTAPVPMYFLAEQDGITLYAYPATDVQFDPERDQERYRALEEGIPALLDSFAKQDGVTWPRLAGYGVLAGADEGGVTLNLVEQKSWFEFTDPEQDDTRMSVAPDAAVGVIGADGSVGGAQISYAEFLSGRADYLGAVFQIYTVDGVVVGLNQQGEAVLRSEDGI